MRALIMRDFDFMNVFLKYSMSGVLGYVGAHKKSSKLNCSRHIWNFGAVVWGVPQDFPNFIFTGPILGFNDL